MQVARPAWREVICAKGNQHVKIGEEAYFLSADGYLMPTKKDQSPPDLKYFGKPQKVAMAADPVPGRAIACDETGALCALPLPARGRACVGQRPEGRPAKRVG